MKRLLYCFMFCATTIMVGQKVVKKSFEISQGTTIQIHANNCFEVRLSTAPTNNMFVEAVMDGEYKSDLTLHTEWKGETLLVTTNFQPNFENPNDKLSAHKVVSIALNITVPAYSKVNIYGLSTNVFATGIYEDLQVTVNDGKCSLREISENIKITTQSGDIYVFGDHANIKAKSKYGKIYDEVFANGNAGLNLSTITGDIHLKKTE